jgi:hypothetical protein
MVRRAVLIPILVGIAAASRAGEERPPGEQWLTQVIARMSDNLKRLPNYTCLQTIDRSRRASAGLRWETVDRVRVEVALVDGKELFAWPGEGKFEDRDLSDMVMGGATSTGNFGLLSKAVFMTGAPNFRFAGEKVLDGRRAYRWDYDVPLERSGYTLRNSRAEAVVAFHGSFWADAQTYDVLRLEATADSIPPRLEMVAASDAVDYQKVSVGAEDFLLPRLSELRITDYGGENRNQTAFSGCRQYAGESVLVFEDASADTQVSRAPNRVIEVPEGLELRLSLKTAVKPDSAVGDPVSAQLTAAVKNHGEVLAPKGAEVRGRVLFLRESKAADAGYVVGLEFNEISYERTLGRMRCKLVEVMQANNIVSTTATVQGPIGLPSRRRVAVEQVNLPGVFFVRRGTFLAAGLQMVWRTLPVSSEEMKP